MLFYGIKEFKEKLGIEKLQTIEFARISRDDGFKNTDSLLNQASMLERTVETNSDDLETIRKYSQVVSGMKELEERGDSVEETFELIRCAGTHLLLIKEYSRFTRNPTLSSQLLDYCDLYYNRFRMYSLIDGLYSPDQRGIWEMKVTFYANEVRTIVKRMKLGKIEKAEKGHYLASKPPLGYTLYKKTLTKKFPECDIVLDIHTRYFANEFLNVEEMTRYLRIRYPGYKWSSRKLRYILTNPVYIGINRYGYRKYYKNKFIEYNDDYVEKKSNFIDVLVPENIFIYNKEKAEKEISSRKKYRGAENYLFSGLLKCYCGGNIYGFDKNYYMCKNRRRGGNKGECYKKVDRVLELDKKILNHIKENYNSIGQMDLSSISINEDTQISKLENDIKNYKERNDVLKEALQLKAITIQEFAEEKNKNDATIFSLNEELKLKENKKEKNDTLFSEKEIIEAVLNTTDKEFYARYGMVKNSDAFVLLL